ncbi:hypothetical protein D9613_002271 [Agrocybe pediades]|uniref:Uncharacterized protein n=1 Tax=Agrocybe pediades TaxID=84607 RepID=A0A8H4R5P9_9AGAR|nr:hypothetical protein D9613_002271 [Agrocybe pediades]
MSFRNISSTTHVPSGSLSTLSLTRTSFRTVIGSTTTSSLPAMSHNASALSSASSVMTLTSALPTSHPTHTCEAVTGISSDPSVHCNSSSLSLTSAVVSPSKSPLNGTAALTSISTPGDTNSSVSAKTETSPSVTLPQGSFQSHSLSYSSSSENMASTHNSNMPTSPGPYTSSSASMSVNTSVPPSLHSPSASHALSPGSKAGIVLGIASVLSLVVIFLYILHRRRKYRIINDGTDANTEFTYPYTRTVPLDDKNNISVIIRAINGHGQAHGQGIIGVNPIPDLVTTESASKALTRVQNFDQSEAFLSADSSTPGIMQNALRQFKRESAPHLFFDTPTKHDDTQGTFYPKEEIAIGVAL